MRVGGIYIGKVERVDLSGSNQPNRVVRVTVIVVRERLASIPVDSYAQIAPETLVGDQFVNITSGTSAEHIRAGGEIPFREEAALLKSLDLRQWEQKLRDTDAVLRDIEEGRSRVGKFILGEEMYGI